MSQISLRDYYALLNNLLGSHAADQVIHHCRYLLQHYPKNVAALRILGVALTMGARYEEAEATLRRVLAVNPDDFEAHYHLSAVYDTQNKGDQAIWHLERALEHRPNDRDMIESVRGMFRRYKRVEQNKILLTAAAVARQAYYNGAYEQAIETLRGALSRQPDRLDMRLLLAQTLWADDNPVEAAETALDVLQQLPDCLEANRILTQLWLMQERPSDAQRYLNRIEAIDPYAAMELATGAPAPDDAFRIAELDYAQSAQQELTATRPDWLGDVDNTAASAGEDDWSNWTSGMLETPSALPASQENVEGLFGTGWLNDLETAATPQTDSLLDAMKADVPVPLDTSENAAFDDAALDEAWSMEELNNLSNLLGTTEEEAQFASTPTLLIPVPVPTVRPTDELFTPDEDPMAWLRDSDIEVLDEPHMGALASALQSDVDTGSILREEEDPFAWMKGYDDIRPATGAFESPAPLRGTLEEDNLDDFAFDSDMEADENGDPVLPDWLQNPPIGAVIDSTPTDNNTNVYAFNAPSLNDSPSIAERPTSRTQGGTWRLDDETPFFSSGERAAQQPVAEDEPPRKEIKLLPETTGSNEENTPPARRGLTAFAGDTRFDWQNEVQTTSNTLGDQPLSSGDSEADAVMDEWLSQFGDANTANNGDGNDESNFEADWLAELEADASSTTSNAETEVSADWAADLERLNGASANAYERSAAEPQLDDWLPQVTPSTPQPVDITWLTTLDVGDEDDDFYTPSSTPANGAIEDAGSNWDALIDEEAAPSLAEPDWFATMENEQPNAAYETTTTPDIAPEDDWLSLIDAVPELSEEDAPAPAGDFGFTGILPAASVHTHEEQPSATEMSSERDASFDFTGELRLPDVGTVVHDPPMDFGFTGILETPANPNVNNTPLELETDWLNELRDENERSGTSGANKQNDDGAGVGDGISAMEAAVSDNNNLDWLHDSDSDNPNSEGAWSAEPEPADLTSDWLTDTETASTASETLPDGALAESLELAGEPLPADDLPDWLAELTESSSDEGSGNVLPPAEAEPVGDLVSADEDWLAELQPVGLVDNNAILPDENEWLTAVEGQPGDLEPAAALDDEDWLNTFPSTPATDDDLLAAEGGVPRTASEWLEMSADSPVEANDLVEPVNNPDWPAALGEEPAAVLGEQPDWLTELNLSGEGVEAQPQLENEATDVTYGLPEADLEPASAMTTDELAAADEPDWLAEVMASDADFGTQLDESIESIATPSNAELAGVYAVSQADRDEDDDWLNETEDDAVADQPVAEVIAETVADDDGFAIPDVPAVSAAIDELPMDETFDVEFAFDAPFAVTTPQMPEEPYSEMVAETVADDDGFSLTPEIAEGGYELDVSAEDEAWDEQAVDEDAILAEQDFGVARLPEDEDLDGYVMGETADESFARETTANAPDWLNAMVPGLDVDFGAQEDAPIETDYLEPDVPLAHEETPARSREFNWLNEIVDEESRDMAPVEAEVAEEEPSPSSSRFVFSRLPAWFRRGTSRSAARDAELPEWPSESNT